MQRKLGSTNDDWIEWNYILGSPRYSGVMAQEIINIIPEAVVTMPNGYLGVNYAKIDVDMLAK